MARSRFPVRRARLPKRRYACASSRPTYPPPTTTRCEGTRAEVERLDVRQWSGGPQAGDRGDRRMRSHVEEHAIAGEHSRPTVVQAHLERLRCHEASRPHDQLGAARLVLLEVHGDEPLDHVALALEYARHVDLDRPRYHPELRRMLHQIDDPGAPDLVLAREAGDVRAGAADPSSFHHDRTVPRFRHVPGHELAADSAAQHENFDFFRRHCVAPLRIESASGWARRGVQGGILGNSNATVVPSPFTQFSRWDVGSGGAWGHSVGVGADMSADVATRVGYSRRTPRTTPRVAPVTRAPDHIDWRTGPRSMRSKLHACAVVSLKRRLRLSPFDPSPAVNVP